MSTRRKKGSGLDLFGFLERRGLDQSLVDYFSMSLRMYRECLRAGVANMDQWMDFAGMLNVGAFRACELEMRDELAVLNCGSSAMTDILSRGESEGMVADDREIAAITDALNCLELRVWTMMTLQDFIRIADGIEKRKEKERERASI